MNASRHLAREHPVQNRLERHIVRCKSSTNSRNRTGPIWKISDEKMTRFATEEAARIGILKAVDVEDVHVVHVPEAYPVSFGS